MARPRTRSRLKLDLSDERLWDGDRVIDLSPKLFFMLRYFVLNPNRLLTKREILAHVWPNTYVTEGSVKDSVQNLRRALGDDPKRPRLIETVHGRGYRYVGDVAVAQANREQISPENRHKEANSVAVIPFKSLDDDLSQRHLSEKITSDLVTRLNKTGMFGVASEISTSDYEDQTVSIRDLGRSLGVRYIIHGNIQSMGSLVRIAVRFVNTATEETLWAEKFDSEVQELLTDLDGVTRYMVGNLLGKYNSCVYMEANSRFEENVENLAIEDYLCRGFFFWHRCTAEANSEARRMFEKIVEVAPYDYRGYQALAWCRSQEARFAWCRDPRESLNLALEIGRKALILDETQFENHWVLGHISLLMRDYETAFAEFRRAVKINPDVPHLIADFGDFFVYYARPQDAFVKMEQAVKLNPYFPNWYAGILARAYADLGNIEAAVETYRSIGASSEEYHLELASLYVRLNRLEDARSEVRKELRTNPEFSLKCYGELYLWKHPYKEYKRAEEKLEQHLDDLRKAGMPG